MPLARTAVRDAPNSSKSSTSSNAGVVIDAGRATPNAGGEDGDDAAATTGFVGLVGAGAAAAAVVVVARAARGVVLADVLLAVAPVELAVSCESGGTAAVGDDVAPVEFVFVVVFAAPTPVPEAPVPEDPDEITATLISTALVTVGESAADP